MTRWVHLSYWLGALSRRAVEHERDGVTRSAASAGLTARFWRLRLRRARWRCMDFSFLFRRERKLLLGLALRWTITGSTPVAMDLLASEARLTSLFRYRQGRRADAALVPPGSCRHAASAMVRLISWSRLHVRIPDASLVMRAPQVQPDRARPVGWWSSASAYGRLSEHSPGHIRIRVQRARSRVPYQYSNFGVPGLGLRRGLAENVDDAPYAAALVAG